MSKGHRVHRKSIMTSINSFNLLQRRELIKRLGKKQNALQKGFTLVELLIVVVILGLLSGVALPNFLSQADKARVASANAEAAALVTACEVALANGDSAAADADVVRLTAALGTDAKALATATTAADSCSVTVTGSAVGTDGSFVAFGAKTPAVAS
jgi:type IV pilus assembly protein PilA